MTSLTVYDAPMCCATGICGSDVDQRLVDLAADLDWLKAQGVAVRRINLSQEPMEFVSNPEIKALMAASDGDDLPAFVIGGRIVSRAHYPSRNELAAWAGIDAPEPGDKTAPAKADGGCCGGGGGAAKVEADCCDASAKPNAGTCC